MTLTDRDRKILLLMVPLLLVVGYWFLLLAPKREEAATAGNELEKQEQRRDTAQQKLAQLQTARTSFAADYAELVRLGKAVPPSVDMPSLLVQLDSAASGTGIDFTRVATGERDASSPGGSATNSPPPAAAGNGNGSQPAASGGQPAQSAPGGAAESAGNATGSANQRSAQSEGAGGAPAQSQGSSPAPAGGAGSSQAPGLDAVPLELEFQGDFFSLADFFHRLKRFVRVANDRVLVQGRLLTVESLKFTSDPELFPKLKAELTATVYLAPKTEGTTAGATPQGPGSTTPAAGQGSPAGGSSSPPPTATATP